MPEEATITKGTVVSGPTLDALLRSERTGSEVVFEVDINNTGVKYRYSCVIENFGTGTELGTYLVRTKNGATIPNYNPTPGQNAGDWEKVDTDEE